MPDAIRPADPPISCTKRVRHENVRFTVVILAQASFAFVSSINLFHVRLNGVVVQKRCGQR